MTKRKNSLALYVGLSCLPFTHSAFALEPGALNPSKPDYQLPAIPEFQEKNQDNAAIQALPTVQNKQTDASARFILKALQFEGNVEMTDEELTTFSQPYLNKAVSRADLEHIRLSLINFYQQKGFIYPSVILPGQHISQGRVRYQIYEGHLSSVKIQGNDGLNESYIHNLMQLETEQPLHKAQLLKGFQYLLADPLIERVNGAIKPGANPGETILDLDITRSQPYALYLGMDNHTPPSVGAYTGRLSGVMRNLTGYGDYLQLDLSGSEGMQGLSSFFSMPFSQFGTRFNIGFQTSQAKVVGTEALKDLNIKNKFLEFNIGLNQPIIREPDHHFNIEMQYAFRQTNTEVSGILMPLTTGVEESGRAGVNELRFIQSYLHRGSSNVISLRSSLNLGFDGFDATINPGQQADSKFVSWQGQFRFLQRLDQRGTELFIRGDMQLSTESLLPLQRFALGGAHTVRGYRMNQLVRDEGYALALEVRYPLYKEDIKEGHRLNLIPFFDFGQAWNEDEATKTLYSAGIGLKWQWQRWGAEFYWAQALNSANTDGLTHDGQDSGLHFQVQTRIF